MAERTYTRRQFIIAGGAAAAAWTLPPERSAEASRVAGEDLAVAGALFFSPCATGMLSEPAPLSRLQDRARSLGAQLHSPVPAGTRLMFWGQPLGIVLAKERHTALTVAQVLADELAAELAPSRTPPILQLAAALPATRTPGTDATTEAATQAAESALSGSPYHLRLTYHSVARLPALSAPLSVFAGAHLPLPHLRLSHPYEPGLRQSLAAWSKLPPDWFTLQVSSPAAEPARFDIPAKLAWSASSKLRRPVELLLTPEQTQVLAGGTPEIIQTLSLGAERDGRLRALVVRVLHTCPQGQDSLLPCAPASELYSAGQRAAPLHIAPLHIGPLLADPAHGYIAGSFAIESALDELATLLGLDPGQLRRVNLPTDSTGRGASLAARCLSLGAARLPWPDGTSQPAPGSRREGAYRIGHGLALGHLPYPPANPAARAPMGYVAHFVRLRVPDGQPSFEVLRHLVVLALPRGASPGSAGASAAEREGLRTGVRQALAAAWERGFAPAPAYDPASGAPLASPLPAMPGLRAEIIDVEFLDVEFLPDDSPPTEKSGNTTGPTNPAQETAALAALAQCGASAALANALYNATGYRQRSLPFDLSLLARPTPTL